MRLYDRGIHFYLLGIIILTCGIAFTIISALGTSPFDSVLVGLHRTFGLTVGSWEIGLGLTFIIGNGLLARKRPEFFALLTSVVTGMGIDMWLFILRDTLLVDTLLMQFVVLMAGFVLCGIGIALYLQSSLAPNPIDRTMLILSNMLKWSVTYSRILINIVLIILAFFLDGAIGIGTLINVIISGSLISIFLPFSKKLKNYSDMRRPERQHT